MVDLSKGCGNARLWPGRLAGQIALALAGVILLSGCTAVQLSDAYRPAASIASKPLVEQLGVSVPEEGRPLEGRSRIGIGFLCFIPLVPYAHQQFTPERYFGNAHMVQYNFREDVAETVAKDLLASGLAQYVHVVKEGEKWTEWKLDLSLAEGIWHRNFTTYGLSFAGVYLWLVGLPVSYGRAEMGLRVKIIDPSGNCVGEKVFMGEKGITESAYVPHKFPKALPLAYGRLSEQMRPWLSENLRRAAASR